ncbi:MAG: hypothetical protein IPL79_10715 [Myxococcales bacterium]|nr:hypothetical protein [Myxococcales bacterium]
MDLNAEIAALNKVLNVATLAGINLELVSQGGPALRGVWNVADGRTQQVRIVVSGSTPSGPLITIWSPALEKKKGVFGGLSAKLMQHLLMENHKRSFARFAVIERKDDYLVVANIDHFVDTLDPDELRASCGLVASAADDIEKQFSSGDDM